MSKTRKYLLTINNPLEHDLTREKLIEICNQLNPIYYCMSDEIGLEEKTPHCHIFIMFENARSFKTIQKEFLGKAHIDVCKGTNQQNKDYIFKEGKWADDEKQDTNIKESHYEYGELPLEEQGKRNDLSALHEMINNGMGLYEILEECPQYSFRIEDIKKLINLKKEKQFKKIFRHLNVVYLYGDTGTGKTRYVMEKYGYENVYRITDYSHPFDSYNYEDVVMFEEFRSDIKIKDMLKYLDGYPLELPCRFSNKQACYTKVYIVSNIPVKDQYKENDPYMPVIDKKTHDAFIRRIKTYMEFDEYGNKFVFESKSDYQNRRFIDLEDYERKCKDEELL